MAASTSSPAPATAAASRSATRRPFYWRRPLPGRGSPTGTGGGGGWLRRGDAASGGSSGWSGSRSSTHPGGGSLPSRSSEELTEDGQTPSAPPRRGKGRSTCGGSTGPRGGG